VGWSQGEGCLYMLNETAKARLREASSLAQRAAAVQAALSVGMCLYEIEEYLDYYLTPGAQHVALITGDIISAVKKLRDNGIEFLRVPDTYYEILPERIGKIDEDYKAIQELGILVDRDDEGYLLQIFTRPIQDRPTMFIEIIQRHGSQSFGKGNFKALFESIEMEQERRGNL